MDCHFKLFQVKEIIKMCPYSYWNTFKNCFVNFNAVLLYPHFTHHGSSAFHSASCGLFLFTLMIVSISFPNDRKELIKMVEFDKHKIHRLRFTVTMFVLFITFNVFLQSLCFHKLHQCEFYAALPSFTTKPLILSAKVSSVHSYGRRHVWIQTAEASRQQRL